MKKGKEDTSNPALLLVSDLDDTIKISNTQSKLITVYRGLFRSSAFTGMAPLYQEILSNHPDSRLLVVSSSPPAIRNKIQNFLKVNRFPEAKLILRDWINQPSVLKFKMKAILELAEKSEFPLLLVGDDTQHDPEVLAHVAKKFPEKVLARYLRIVKGRELPEGSQGFFTAFEIACAELAAGRLSSEQVLRVGESILRAEKNSRLIPWFSMKPPLHLIPHLKISDDTVEELWHKIQKKIDAIPRKKLKK